MDQKVGRGRESWEGGERRGEGKGGGKRRGEEEGEYN